MECRVTWRTQTTQGTSQETVFSDRQCVYFSGEAVSLLGFLYHLFRVITRQLFYGRNFLISQFLYSCCKNGFYQHIISVQIGFNQSRTTIYPDSP